MPFIATMILSCSGEVLPVLGAAMAHSTGPIEAKSAKPMNFIFSCYSGSRPVSLFVGAFGPFNARPLEGVLLVSCHATVMQDHFAIDFQRKKSAEPTGFKPCNTRRGMYTDTTPSACFGRRQALDRQE